MVCLSSPWESVFIHLHTYVLDNGFSEQWNRATIDVNSGTTGGNCRPEMRSLDAAGIRALVLRHINSTVVD